VGGSQPCWVSPERRGASLRYGLAEGFGVAYLGWDNFYAVAF